MINNNIKKLRKLIKSNNLDGYIIPKNDEFFSEFAYPDRLKKISNFTGSAGLAIVLKNKNYLFVDGRYVIQAKQQSDDNFVVVQIPNSNPKKILKKFKNKLYLGFDPKLFTSSSLNKNFGNFFNLIPINVNLIDKIKFSNKSKKNKYFYSLSNKITGENISSKINKLILALKYQNIDNIFISASENIAWLLNLRGNDNPHSPIPNSNLILTKNKKIYFFSDKNKINKIKNVYPYKNFYFKEFKDIYNVINKLPGKSFCIDHLTCSVFFQSLITSKFNCKLFVDPCYHMKAIKNKIEINNMIKAHEYDGAALTKFIYWIKNKRKRKNY